MQIFGIGPLEFIFILVIMVLVLGPRGMVQAARETGKLIRKVVRSPLWRDVVGTSREIRNLPQKIVREAGIEQEVEELKQSMDSSSTPETYRILDYPAEEKRNQLKTSPDDISSKNDEAVRSIDQPAHKRNPKSKHNKNP